MMMLAMVNMLLLLVSFLSGLRKKNPAVSQGSADSAGDQAAYE